MSTKSAYEPGMVEAIPRPALDPNSQQSGVAISVTGRACPKTIGE
ncbi:MAG: hypothetical protein ABR990_05100 [Terracidiphilus sp.]